MYIRKDTVLNIRNTKYVRHNAGHMYRHIYGGVQYKINKDRVSSLRHERLSAYKYVS